MVRLDVIVTRQGDAGDTGLADGRRVPKDDCLIQAIGAVDEANSVLGLVRLENLPAAIATALPGLQNDLFDLGADLAMPDHPGAARTPLRMSARQVAGLEQLITAALAVLTPLTSFVLPAGSRAATVLHLARTVVRRAERDVVSAIHADPQRTFNPDLLRYLNRLSDLCFVWARQCNADGHDDVLWVPGGKG